MDESINEHEKKDKYEKKKKHVSFNINTEKRVFKVEEESDKEEGKIGEYETSVFMEKKNNIDKVEKGNKI